MCCFARPVEDVRSTRIFARLTGRGSQLLVYQMMYRSAEENAMILPIPVRQPAAEPSVRFVDLKDYPDFFVDLFRGFPYIPPAFQMCCGSPDMVTASAGLEVYEVGNYVASFVPRIADFDRLDPRFTLSPETWAEIPQYQDFGFAVFQLASGALEPHPMALEFETAQDSIFFPTVHIHDGQIHPREYFDHVLYAQHAGLDDQVRGYQNATVPDAVTGLIRSKFTAKSFCDIELAKGIVEPDLLVHRHIIEGTRDNQDTLFNVSGDPINRTFHLRSLWPYAPWVVMGTAVAWLFARRSRLRRQRGEGVVNGGIN